MSTTGLGVLLNRLRGDDETGKTIARAIGKKITGLAMKDDMLFMDFEDGYRIRVWDNGQSCCENRYMMTDDNLTDFIGSVFAGAEIREAQDEPAEYGEHEVQFLLVNTSLGTFTMVTHNEHNGYYGGFSISAKEVKQHRM